MRLSPYTYFADVQNNHDQILHRLVSRQTYVTSYMQSPSRSKCPTALYNE